MGSLKYRNLYIDIRDRITAGHYSIDEPLPSIRKLSKELELSRTTVENAYNQLLLEGFIYSIQGVGYFVNEKARSLAVEKKAQGPVGREMVEAQVVYDLRNEYSNSQVFDLKVWKKHLNHILTYEKEALYKKPDSSGELALRTSIANYLKVSRNVYVEASDLYIGAGIQALLLNLLHMLQGHIQGLVIENPGFSTIARLFQRNQLPVTTLPVIRGTFDEGLLEGLTNQLAYVSPAHQIPTGHVMKLDGRYQLLDWAKGSNSYIIEDDFNAELRYDLFPVASLKSMDKEDRVIYLGSFSTYLLPTIRISYMILPKALQEAFGKSHLSQTTSIIDQLAFSRMIDSGDFSRHISRIKTHYTRKSEALVQMIETHLSDYVRVVKNQSGLKQLLVLKQGLTEEAVIGAAREQGIILEGIQAYVLQGSYEETILLNFRGIGSREIGNIIEALRRVFQSILGCKS